ncbi:MAG: tRNA 5-methoxyuridine(34)/uridine 5-oxyacetic acid(34) synthase CmoB, partial [SAR324 cluster bacterium]
SPLKNRTILDVGCGNGYHCWRMAGAGASFVLGIDPSILAVMQYQTLHHFIGPKEVYVTPHRLEELPGELNYFDTVFSMGILYHRRSPIDHIYELKECLKPGGELVLETLVVNGDINTILVPEGRYAQMRNVWFIPSCLMMENWLSRCGFLDVKCIESNHTSLDEQRSTDWMPFSSLPQFLDPKNSSRTIEGLPAPMRATFKIALLCHCFSSRKSRET